MSIRRSSSLAIVALALCACTMKFPDADASGVFACDSNADCKSGFTCEQHRCLATCAKPSDCPSGSCTAAGTCAPDCSDHNGGCDSNATCRNLPTARTCACASGYDGNGLHCTDVNECLVDNGGCDANATCTNQPGTFACDCDSGYDGNGFTCTDIDECAVNNGDCDVNAICANQPGTRTCTCKPSYSGNGTTCTSDCPDGCDTNATCTGPGTCVCNPGTFGSGTLCTPRWTALNVPGAAVERLVPSPDGAKLYAATRAGLFVRTAASAWQTVPGPFEHQWVTALVFDPTNAANVYASTSGDVFRSRDGGATWQAVTDVPTAPVVQLLMDSHTPAGLYVQTVTAVFRSTNGGDTWSEYGPSTVTSIRDLALRDTGIEVSLYAATPEGLMIRRGSGAWSLAGAAVRVESVLVAAPAHVYVVRGDYGNYKVERSDNDGGTWTDLSVVGQSPSYSRLCLDGAGTLYAGVSQAAVHYVMHSGDSALHTAPAEAPTTFQACAELGGDVYLGGGGGVYRWDSAAWQAANDGLTVPPLSAVAVAAGHRIVVASMLAGLVRQDDNQSSWTARSSTFPSIDTMRALAVDPGATNIVYAGGFGCVYKSTDSGWSWTRPTTCASGTIEEIAVVPGAGASQNIYAAATGGLFKSTDAGDTWTQLGCVAPLDPAHAVAIHPSNPSIIYVGTFAGFFASSDGGDTCTSRRSGGSVNAIAISSTWDVFFAFQSNMGGSSIEKYTPGAAQSTTVVAAPYDLIQALAIGGLPERLYVGLFSSYTSTLAVMQPGATSWTLIPSLPDGPMSDMGLSPEVSSLLFDPTQADTLLVGTGQGLYSLRTDNL